MTIPTATSRNRPRLPGRADPAGSDLEDESGSVGQALYALVSGAVRRSSREVSLTAVATLATLDRVGARRITELAAIQGVTQPSMTACVAGLERSGYVSRRADPGDGRASLVSLTPSGREFLCGRRRRGAAGFARLVVQLGAADRAALAAAVPALRRLQQLDDAEREATPGG